MSTNCPLCGRLPSGILNSFSLAEVAEVFTSRARGRERLERMTAILGGMWRGDRVNVMRCDPCSFGYAVPFVAGSAEFYHLQAPDTPYPRDKWEYEQTLRCLAEWPVADFTLLDIGAGKGHFEAQLIERGWKPEALRATEFSFAGKEAIEQLGVECRQCDVRSLDVGGMRFDAICLFQVLEHLDGYDDLFEAVSRLAKPDAHLFIAVPNGARIAFNEESGLLYDYPPNHVSRWSPRSFQILADKYGWRLDGCEAEPEPTMLGEAVYGAVNRFLRQSQVPGAWAKTVCATTDKGALSRKANRIVKTLGMMVSPDAWLAAARVGYAARRGRGVPHALWAHLRRGRRASWRGRRRP